MNGYKTKILNISVLILLICSIIIPVVLANPQPVKAVTGVIQPIIGTYAALVGGGATNYTCISGGNAWAATENAWWQIVATAGTFSQFYVLLSTAPGAGQSYAFTLRVNGASTSLTCTVSDTATYALNITNTVSVSAGDYVDIMCVASAGPAASNYRGGMYFTSNTDYYSILPGAGNTNMVVTNYFPITQGNASCTATENNVKQVIPKAGTIQSLYIRQTLGAGLAASGDAYRYTLRLNGVSQTLTCTLSETATTGSDLVNTVAVVAGDLVDIMVEPINGPANNPTVAIGMVFVSTTQGESLVIGGSSGNLNTGANRYNFVVQAGYSEAWDATESNQYGLSQKATYRNLYVSLSGSPDNGAGTQSYTFYLRSNGSSTALTCSISEASTTGSDTSNQVSVLGGSLVDVLCVPANTPTARYAYWSMVCYVDTTAYTAPFGVASMYESLTTSGDAGGTACYGSRWVGQTFTTTSAHSVTSVKILLQRTGTPGTLTLSIKGTDAAGLPSGADLCSATYNGDILNTASYNWTEFTFTGYHLEYGSKYVLVLRALSGTAANYVQWYWDTGNGYADGNAVESNDGGAFWYTLGVVSNDYLFQIWGTPTLDIIRAKVFKSYINNGDWLIVTHYENFYTPYYEENYDISQLFVHQLVDGTTVLAETSVIQWGYMPGAIYLSADSVTSFEWGHGYKVRMYGNFTPYPYADYQLVAGDWIGEDLTFLDKWCRSTALLMESYYSADYTDAVAGKGIVLNEAGGVLFENGIPAISTVRKDLFKVASDKAPYTQDAYAHTLQKETIWQTKLGPVLTEAFTSFGNILSISGAWAVSLFIFILFAVVVAFSFAPGHAIGAIAIAFPILLLTWWIGVWPLVAMAVLLSLIVFWIVWQVWFKGG